MNRPTELKPCPFCGGKAHLDTVGKGGSRHAAVFCDDVTCPGVVHGVGAGIENQRLSAIASWNRRPEVSLSAALAVEARPTGHVDIAHDGFSGDIIGHYITREGKRGVVVQQEGTRVVHVYGEKWLSTPTTSPSSAVEAVAWCQPNYEGKVHPRKFMVVYEDQDMGNAVFEDEAEAREHFEKASIAWNCYLFGLLPRRAVPTPAGEWKTMDSAPKDGTPILGWNEKYGARETKWEFYGEGSMAHAAFKAGHGPSGMWGWHEPMNNWCAAWTPTLWMPLPLPASPAPQTEGRADG